MCNICSICLSRRKKQKMFKAHSSPPSSLGMWYVENSQFCFPQQFFFMQGICPVLIYSWQNGVFWKRCKRVQDSMKKYKNKFLKCFSLEHLKMKIFSAPQPLPWGKEGGLWCHCIAYTVKTSSSLPIYKIQKLECMELLQKAPYGKAVMKIWYGNVP